MRIQLWIVGLAALANAGAASRLARADAVRSNREANIELAPDVGFGSRPAEGGHGATYSVGFVYGAHIQVPLLRFLRFSAYYSHLSQSITVAPGTLGGGAPVQPLGDLDSYVIGARVQPTLHLSDRLRLWANLGAAWGVMTAPALRVPAAPPFDVGRHGDAFFELPFGAGGEYDFWPQWASITTDVALGPVIGGFDLDRPRQTIDASGRLVSVPTLPPASSSWSVTIGVALHL